MSKTQIFHFLNVQVTHNSHRYLKEVEMREEGGTPAIVESIRAGLVFQLKEVSLIHYNDVDISLLYFRLNILDI
jgi:hypothetical protein